ncbi:MAG: GNAT family N-acetyltransferase [Gemmatimonadota bacterium]|nr:GNAT family N-acetyltransferase [Gemmatimonadota bacterium]
MKVEFRSPRNQSEFMDTVRCFFHEALDNKTDFDAQVRREAKYIQEDPWITRDDTLAAFLDGKVVSLVQIFRRPIHIGKFVLQMGGIGSVYTLPAYRHKRYSSQLMKVGVAYMKEAGYDISFLTTRIPSHYAKEGWVVYPTFSMRLDLPSDGFKAPNESHVDCGPFNEDSNGIIAIYSQFNSLRSGTVVRNSAYWYNQIEYLGDEPALYWKARRNGELAAYLRSVDWNVVEVGFSQGQDRELVNLLKHVFAHARAEGVKTIDALVPLNFQGLFEGVGCKVSRSESCSMMVRIINFESLLRKIIPLLRLRLVESDFSKWKGLIAIQYEAGIQVLNINEGELSILIESVTPDISLRLSQEQLIKLLFGDMGIEHIIFSNNLDLKKTEVELLNVLFPRDQFCMWDFDCAF